MREAAPLTLGWELKGRICLFETAFALYSLIFLLPTRCPGAWAAGATWWEWSLSFPRWICCAKTDGALQSSPFWGKPLLHLLICGLFCESWCLGKTGGRSPHGVRQTSSRAASSVLGEFMFLSWHGCTQSQGENETRRTQNFTVCCCPGVSGC